MHIFFNTFALLSLGPITEQIYGSKKMLLILLVSIISGSWLALILSPANVIGFGLSGGIFGLFGAIVLYYFQTGLIRERTVSRRITTLLIMNLMISLLPGVSFFGHLGGFIGGLLVSMAIINEPRWAQMKKSAIAALVALFIFFGVFSLRFDTNRTQVVPSVDIGVVEAFRELGIDWYADHLENSIDRYYREIGVRR
jgi:rhomboid protease GluP